MEQMREHEYKDALGAFLKIVEAQPGLFGSRAGGAAVGTHLSEIAWAFIEHFAQKKRERVLT